MKISIEVSEATIMQLEELNSKEGLPGRTDLELLSDLVTNIVDLSHEYLVAEERKLRLVR